MKHPEMRKNLHKNRGWVIGETANKKIGTRIRTVGLPFELTRWIESKEEEITLLNHLISTKSKRNHSCTIEEELKIANDFLKEFKEKLVETKCANKLIDLINRYLVCFGPKRWGPNILINQIINESDSLFSRFTKLKQENFFEEEKKEVIEEENQEENNEEAKLEKAEDSENKQ